jgi:hypothetical protein
MSRFAALGAAALLLLSAAGAQARVDIRPQPDGVTVSDDGKPVLFFRTRTPDPAQPGRLAYVHPLQAPDGTVLTEDQPADHPSQRGLYWGWPQVLLNGQAVADSWNLKGMTFFVRATRFQGATDGSGALSFDIDWIVSSRPELVYVASETTKITVRPLARGARRIEIDTVVTPRVDGLAVSGGEKGEGGLALRLARPDRLVFNSGKTTVAATPGPLTAGPAMGFSWPAEAGAPAYAVGLACRAQGLSLTQWILRHELSGQNCVFPGRTAYAISRDRPLHLQATLVIQPRSPAK